MNQIRTWLTSGLIWTIAVGASACLLAPACLAQNPHVLFETTMGDFEIELNEKEAPRTVENFLNYVKKGHYEGTIFHRIIPTFVVQGGGLDADMKERNTDDPIMNESSNGLKNERMTLSMARTSSPHSATSQFYVNLKDNSSLDRANAADNFGYCVFGKVVKGEEVIDKMAAVKTANKGRQKDVPVEPIVVKKVTLLDGEKN